MRGCPVCLLEDAKKAPNDPIPMMAMRGDWLLREVNVCCRHGHVLVPLWEHTRPVDRYDTRANLRAILVPLLAGDLGVQRRPPSSYDLWLDRRLQFGQDATWLATQGLYVSTTMCSLLGSTLAPRVSGELDEVCASQQAGFAVLAEGVASYREVLRHLAMQSESSQFNPRRVFGRLYDVLGDNLRDDQFDLFRNVLRDCILDTWPLAEGDVVLGEPVQERTLHSVVTAAREFGVSASLLEKFVIEAGAIPDPDLDPRPPALRTFDARRYADLLAEIPTLVGPTEMQAAIGATKSQLRSLKEDGILKPRIARDKIASPWRIDDGLALLRELEMLSVEIRKEEPGWEDIQSASKRMRLKVGEIIEAARRTEIQLGRVLGTTGYRNFMVSKSEIDKLARDGSLNRPGIGLVIDVIPASAFARSLGIRGEGWFRSLFEAGYARAKWMQHPINNVRILYVSGEDIDAFNQCFLTLSQMQIEFGLHRWTCAAKLKKAGVVAFSPDGRDFGPIYERSKVEPVLRGARP